MEPTHNSFTGSNELPQPQEVGSGQAIESGPAATPEQQTVAPPMGQASVSTQPTPTSQQPFSITPPVPAQAPSTYAAGTQTLIADDADLIEKEWVVKAKAIVAQTKDDPHLQNQEMTKVKADYLKKRYNKDLKVSDG